MYPLNKIHSGVNEMAKIIKTVEYTLPDFWASPLLYADESGLSDEDVDALGKWCIEHPGLVCTGVADDAEFKHRHDASPYVLACECSTFTFIKRR